MSELGTEDLMESAQRVAGVLAARQRGDQDGAERLLQSFAGQDDLAGGAMLLAHLSLGLYARETGTDFEHAARSVCVDLEAAVRSH